MRKFFTNSADETQKLAGELAVKYRSGAIIALTGNLGAGKTTFAGGFAKGLGIKSKIISPTFVLVKEYPIPHQHKAKLYHIDLYRLENQQQILNLGLKDIFDNHENVVLIEWAEKLTDLPDKQLIKINFEYLSESRRQITVSG